MKTYYIYSLNCDCTSYDVAYYRHPRRDPRCRSCNKILGFMDVSHIDTVSVENANHFDALAEYSKRVKEGIALWQVKDKK